MICNYKLVVARLQIGHDIAGKMQRKIHNLLFKICITWTNKYSAWTFVCANIFEWNRSLFMDVYVHL